MNLSRFDAIIAAVLTLRDDRTPGDQDAATATRRFTQPAVLGLDAPPEEPPVTTKTRGRRRADRQTRGRTNRWMDAVFHIRKA